MVYGDGTKGPQVALSDDTRVGGLETAVKSAVNKDPTIDPNIGQYGQHRIKPDSKPFRLSKSFTEKYSKVKPPFGFDGLGELVYKRTYSRTKEDGTNEEWYETIERVVNGTYTMQKNWIEEHGLRWEERKGQESAQEMYDKIFNLKFTPPGRGLWAMGSPITEERGLYAALNNCAFVSTENIKDDLAAPFTFLMDASMLGVGVGFDTKGADQLYIKGVDKRRQLEFYDIPDTREGWVESVRILLESYFLGTPEVKFGYEKIRPAGAPIKGFGGKSSGPEPLKELHEGIRKTLENQVNSYMTATSIVDIQNLIGKAVVAGNVRRTAEIAFGDPHSEEYLDLKNYKVNPERAEYGWASNNSVFAYLGMDYGEIAKRINDNGEPGLAWLENMRVYGRMKDPPNNKDHRAKGGNPCLEQTLESYELCCLVETYPHRHESKEEYLRTIKFAYLYAKTVTLGKTHWPETNRVLLRNRRIGASMSGIAQFIDTKGIKDRGLEELINWSDEGYNVIQKYDEIYSDWLCIPKSIKTTSIKPSGTVSLLAGATPGVHWPEARHYLRRIRLSKHSNLIPALKEAGYNLEPAFGSENSTLVVEIPVALKEKIRTNKEVSMWEKLSIAAIMQRHWADNQVSCTVSFDPKTEGHQIESALNYFQRQLKGISFLPFKEDVYPQMPYEEISEEKYEELKSKLKPLDLRGVSETVTNIEKFCDGDKCTI
ncbi:MAG: fused protease/ribonucleoside-triphosphate reductase [Candidatus Nanoarchaeia archaeon]|nr:fused protease/ribonucleoside-triphosphate reductase [Candidatus Nanoarchaeia archaeon]